jgi:cystathionine beta-lyase/cystathionine gamma-synthase
MTDGMRFETAAIHVGQDPDPTTGAAIVPLYQTSTFVQEGVAKHRGFEYARTDNPTRKALETCLAALEGAEHAIAFGSGMAAITTLALTLSSGDRVLIPDDVYGGTYRLFAKVLSDLGIRFATVDMTDLQRLQTELKEETALVIAETPTNPLLKILDLQAIAELCRDTGASLAVDNTFATPYIQRPLDLGAHISIYSATKYLGGHSDLVLGSLATSETELASRLQFLQNSVGAIPGPFDCWLLLRGLKTLGIRMRAHSAGAERVAEWLSARDEVSAVHFPGLSHAAGHAIATKQMAAAGEPLYGGMVSLQMGDAASAIKICESTKLFWLGESLGGVESLIEYPAKMTHASLEGSGLEVPDDLIRLSVGIEHPDDLIADLTQAFS